MGYLMYDKEVDLNHVKSMILQGADHQLNTHGTSALECAAHNFRLKPELVHMLTELKSGDF